MSTTDDQGQQVVDLGVEMSYVVRPINRVINSVYGLSLSTLNESTQQIGPKTQKEGGNNLL